jgi:hypothetical protein
VSQNPPLEPLQSRIERDGTGPGLRGLLPDRHTCNVRFLDAALASVQARGCTESEAHQLVDYVFGRPVGDPPQEVGGVVVTFAAFCLANGIDMDNAGHAWLQTRNVMLPALGSLAPARASFQSRVEHWMMVCFGPEISADRIERNHRFLEEALELVQAHGFTMREAHRMVAAAYQGRPQVEGTDARNELLAGCVMVELAVLCLANRMDMHHAGEVELARIWTKVEAIRAKQAAKPRHSPLPGPTVAGEPGEAGETATAHYAASLPDQHA